MGLFILTNSAKRIAAPCWLWLQRRRRRRKTRGRRRGEFAQSSQGFMPACRCVHPTPASSLAKSPQLPIAPSLPRLRLPCKEWQTLGSSWADLTFRDPLAPQAGAAGNPFIPQGACTTERERDNRFKQREISKVYSVRKPRGSNLPSRQDRAGVSLSLPFALGAGARLGMRGTVS